MDSRGIILISGFLTLLTFATFIVEFLRRRPKSVDSATLASCRSRINAWWLLFSSLICALLLGTGFPVLFFGVVSFWALREYVTITPTRLADHKMLVGVFFVLTPLQFFLVGVDSDWFQRVVGYDSYFFYSAMIPSLAFLLLPAIVALSDDVKFYLERIAKLQVGLLICVYSLSFVPAILTMNLSKGGDGSAADVSGIVAANLESKVIEPIEQMISSPDLAVQANSTSVLIEGEEREPVESEIGSHEKSPGQSPYPMRTPANVTLLFVFVVLTQVSDVAQFLWSLAFPRHKVAAKVNSNRTYEGLTLGVLTTVIVAIALVRFLPFDSWQKAGMAGAIVACMGFAGNMTLSAIKRDRGVSEFDSLIEGHNGVLDRIDSLCFAAPAFFHFIRMCC